MSLDGIVQKAKYTAAAVLASAMLSYGQSIPVIGRVVDNGVPLPGSNVSVFTSADGLDHRIDRGVSGSDGRFRVLSNATDVDDDGIVPFDYSLSNPFPNPSAGVSNVHFSVPKPGDVDLKVFNILGEECFSGRYDVSSGTYAIGFDLHNYSSGVYIVGLFSGNKIVGSKKFVVDKKLIVGDGPLSLKKVSGLSEFYKPETVRFIDSVVVSRANYKSSVVRNVGPLVGDSVDIGDVAMFTGLANANVLVYDLKFFRQKELHPIAGAVVRLGLDSIVTDANGRGSFTVTATNVPFDVRVTHPSMRTRETKVLVDRDKNLDFDVLTFDSYPDSVYNFIQKNFGANAGAGTTLPFMGAHWLVPPEFVFKVDTTLASPNPQIQSWMQLINFNLAKMDSFVVPFSENPMNPEGFLKDYKWKVDKDANAYSWNDTTSVIVPGKYCVAWDDSVYLKYGWLAGTLAVVDNNTGILYIGSTVYDSFKFYPNSPAVWRNIDRITVHELDTGIYKTSRDTSIQSVSNRGPPYEFRNYTENDRLIRPYLLSRPPGTVAPDKDGGWFMYTENLHKPSNNLIEFYSFTMQDGRTIQYQEKINGLELMKGLSDAKIREIIRKAKE